MSTPFEVTPATLFLAAEKRDVKFLQKALGSSACTAAILNDKTVSGDKNSVLLEASWRGDSKFVAMLLTRGDLNVRTLNKYGNSALSLAAMYGQAEIVSSLLEKEEVDVNSVNERKQTPLIVACSEEQTECALELLGDPRVDLRWFNKDGDTALHIAAHFGDANIVDSLLSSLDHLNVNAINKYGRTPLYLAAKAGHKKVVKALLNASGINADLRDVYGKSPLFAAASGGHEKVAAVLLRRPDVDCNNTDNMSPLRIACENGHDDIVQLLLEQPRVAFNQTDKKHLTALEHAVRGGFTRIVKMLLAQPGIKVLKEDGLVSDNTRSRKIKSYLQYFEFPRSDWSPLFSWLAVQLLDQGVHVDLVRHCETRLILHEGFVLEKDFAELPEAEMHATYLDKIGITGKGVQVRVRKLHKELQVKYKVVQVGKTSVTCATQTDVVSEAVSKPPSASFTPVTAAPLVVAPVIDAPLAASVATSGTAPVPDAPAAVVPVTSATAAAAAAGEVAVPAPDTSTTAEPVSVSTPLLVAAPAPIPSAAPLEVAVASVATGPTAAPAIPTPSAVPLVPSALGARMRSEETTQVILSAVRSTSVDPGTLSMPVEERAMLMELCDKVHATLAKYATSTHTITPETAAAVAPVPVLNFAVTSAKRKRKVPEVVLEPAVAEPEVDEMSSISAYDSVEYNRCKGQKRKPAAGGDKKTPNAKKKK